MKRHCSGQCCSAAFCLSGLHCYIMHLNPIIGPVRNVARKKFVMATILQKTASFVDSHFIYNVMQYTVELQQPNWNLLLYNYVRCLPFSVCGAVVIKSPLACVPREFRTIQQKWKTRIEMDCRMNGRLLGARIYLAK